jgi:hypothetical protein
MVAIGNNDNNNDDAAPADDVRTKVDLWAPLLDKLAAMPTDSPLREVNISGFGGLAAWHLNKFAYQVTAVPESIYFRVLKITREDVYESRAEFSYKEPDVKKALGHLANDLRAAVRNGRYMFVAELAMRINSF